MPECHLALIVTYGVAAVEIDQVENNKSQGHSKTLPGVGIWTSSAPGETHDEK